MPHHKSVLTAFPIYNTISTLDKLYIWLEEGNYVGHKTSYIWNQINDIDHGYQPDKEELIQVGFVEAELGHGGQEI